MSSWYLSRFEQKLVDSLWAVQRRGVTCFVDEKRMAELCENLDCQRIVELMGEFWKKREEEELMNEERPLLAENRVKELTEGLKETMLLFKEREQSFDGLARINKEQEKKIQKLDHRVASLQNAQFLRCKYCQKVPEYLKVLRTRLTDIFHEQQRGIQDMSQLKQGRLEVALSEKDSSIARFEVDGVKSQDQIEELEQLRLSRNKLNDQLKVECENFATLIANVTAQETDTFFFLDQIETEFTTLV